ncbi:MAG TPA: hypothetical protein PKC30_15445 [Saprospiraceae bacterium]|nr:hypothetical protein [Saprospiraceae bacterium]
MKSLTVLFLLLFGIVGYGQGDYKYNGKRAKDAEEYKRMFKDSKVKMVRSHREFWNIAKEDTGLKTIFDQKTLRDFMSELAMGDAGIASYSYKAIMEKHPKDYHEKVNYIVGFFGLEELFDGRNVAANATHIEGYCCCYPDCCQCTGGVCVFENCKSANTLKKGSDLINEMNSW